MRQETIIKTYLKFSELNENQKSKVIEKMSHINTSHEWYDSTYCDFTDKLKKLGFYNIKFEFSGFWSQGDGASFSASHRRGSIYKVGRYCHSNTMHCMESEVLLSVAKRIADDLYKLLESEYEYLTSDDSIAETILANEYEFDSETLSLV